MNNVEIVKDSLNTILKNGDLYDTIALREGVSPQKNIVLKNHILFLSRILYIGVLTYDKVKSLLSPIEKVKKAQDQIRNIVGANIDIIRSKKSLDLNNVTIGQLFKDTYLSVYYENSNGEKEEYLKELKKILDFCELYNIEEILLKESDLFNLFAHINSSDYKKINIKKVLDFQTSDNKDLDYELITLKQGELLALIKKLEVVKIDKKFIMELSKDIEDVVVKNAINDFVSNGDIDNLKSIINHRLALLINGENTYKDKANGKVFENIQIKDEYIKVMSNNSNGDITNNTITTLYDYLGVLDFTNLLNQTKFNSDEKELLLISALYLYLCNNYKVKESVKSENISFYDRVYNSFKAKHRGEINKIPGLYTKSNKRRKNLESIFLTYVTFAIMLVTVALTGLAGDGLYKLAVKNPETDVFTNVIEGAFYPYIYSFNLEKQLVERLLGIAQDVDDYLSDITGSITGDNNNESMEVVGTMIRFKNSDSYPTYYATGYSDKATYEKGAVSYDIVQSLIDSTYFEGVERIFEVGIDISRNGLKGLIKDGEIAFKQYLYPVGGNYILSSIEIRDLEDDSKVFEMDGFRAANWGNQITTFEEEMLRSMKKPVIYYSYGISNENRNAFVEQLADCDPEYSNLPSDVLRTAITNGLGLSPEASIESIYSAIRNKTYSYTPIKDAGLSKEIKKMDEKEYYESVASLDSLICNLAATLAIGANQDLHYIKGYHDDGDGFIREKEAHGWAMDDEGNIIDVTPNTLLIKENELSKAIDAIYAWGEENHIPLYALIAFICRIIYKIFGKKIKLSIKVNAVEKILDNPDTEISYAKIKDSLYGGINIPGERTPIELMDRLNKELSAFTVDELKQIREELLITDFDNDKKLFNNGLKLIDNIPFIRENEDAIKMSLKKRS